MDTQDLFFLVGGSYDSHLITFLYDLVQTKETKLEPKTVDLQEVCPNWIRIKCSSSILTLSFTPLEKVYAAMQKAALKFDQAYIAKSDWVTLSELKKEGVCNVLNNAETRVKRTSPLKSKQILFQRQRKIP